MRFYFIFLRRRALPFARPRRGVAAVDATGQAGLARMTQITIGSAPSNAVVMTHAAKLAIDDVGHQHIIAARAHLEAQLGMANFAAKAYAVEPMREHNGSYALFLRPLVQYHIAILGMRWKAERCKPEGKRAPKHETDRTGTTKRLHPSAPFVWQCLKIARNHLRTTLWQRLHSVNGKATAP